MADNNQQPAAAAAPAPPLPPVAGVMPANNNHRRSIKLVTIWSLLNGLIFCVVLLVAVHTPCRTKQATWVFRCLALTDTSAAELLALVSGGAWCSLAAELSALLHMVLTSCSCWAVDALAWVALAATVGVHCVEVAAGSIGLAAHPEDDTTLYVGVVLACICLIVDLLAIAGLLLCWCCSRRRRKLLGG